MCRCAGVRTALGSAARAAASGNLTRAVSRTGYAVRATANEAAQAAARAAALARASLTTKRY